MQAEATNAVLDGGPFPIVADKCYFSDALSWRDASPEDSVTKPATVVAALKCAPCNPERIEEPLDFVSSVGFFVFGRGCNRVARA